MKTTIRLTLGVLAVGIIPACDNPVALPSWAASLAIGVVFQQQRDVSTVQEIWGADLEGVRLLRLSDVVASGGTVVSYAWSPDRKWLAFVSDREYPGNLAVYVVEMSGPGVAIRASSFFSNLAGALFWAPDSSRVAYTAGSSYDLYTVRPDVAGSEVQISGALVASGSIRNVQWAPDSSRIGYAADQETLNKIELYTSLPGGGGNVKVSGALFTTIPGADPIKFAWAPNSSRLAYKGDGNTSSVVELYTTLPTGPGSAVRVSPPTTVFAGWTLDYKWAPDSSRIAYTINTINPTIYTSPPDTSTGSVQVSGVTTVTSDWAWASNSSRIGFHTTGLVQSVAPTGGAIATVNGALTPGGSVQGFQWAPDSSRILYAADQDVLGVREIYTSTPTGGGNVKVSAPAGLGSAQSTGWSPDSRWIHYQANPDGGFPQLFVTKPTNATGVVQLSAVVSSSGINVAWTTDSSRLLYTAKEDLDLPNAQDLFAANPSTSGVVKLSGPFVSGQTDINIFTPR